LFYSVFPLDFSRFQTSFVRDVLIVNCKRNGYGNWLHKQRTGVNCRGAFLENA